MFSTSETTANAPPPKRKTVRYQCTHDGGVSIITSDSLICHSILVKCQDGLTDETTDAEALHSKTAARECTPPHEGLSHRFGPW